MKIKKMAAWTGAAVLATGAAAMGAPMASAAVDVVAQADAATSEAPAPTGDNDAAWAAAGGVVLISVAGGVYALRRRASQ